MQIKYFLLTSTHLHACKTRIGLSEMFLSERRVIENWGLPSGTTTGVDGSSSSTLSIASST